MYYVELCLFFFFKCGETRQTVFVEELYNSATKDKGKVSLMDDKTNKNNTCGFILHNTGFRKTTIHNNIHLG